MNRVGREQREQVGREHENSQGPMSIALCQLKLHAKIV